MRDAQKSGECINKVSTSGSTRCMRKSGHPEKCETVWRDVCETVVKRWQKRPEPRCVPERHPQQLFRQRQAVIAHEGSRNEKTASDFVTSHGNRHQLLLLSWSDLASRLPNRPNNSHNHATSTIWQTFLRGDPTHSFPLVAKPQQNESNQRVVQCRREIVVWTHTEILSIKLVVKFVLVTTIWSWWDDA